MVVCSDRFTAKRLHGGAWVETNACVVKSARVGHQVVPTHSSVMAAVGSVAAASTLALVSASLVATSSSASCEPVGLPPFVAQPKFRLGSKYQSLVLKDTACVTRLLQRLHKRSGVFTELFGLDGKLTPSVDMMTICSEMLVGDKQPGCVASYTKECFHYLDWADALAFDILAVGAVALCSYLRSTSERGRSVPNAVRCALGWCEVFTKTGLGASEQSIKAFVSRLTTVSLNGKTLRAPCQAPPVPPDSIRALEALITSGHTLPIRVFAGVAVLCCHGVKRWSDAQHYDGMLTSADAVVVTSWKS